MMVNVPVYFTLKFSVNLTKGESFTFVAHLEQSTLYHIMIFIIFLEFI